MLEALQAALDEQAPPGPALAPAAPVAALLRGHGLEVLGHQVAEAPTASVTRCALCADELSRAGDHAEQLVDRVAGVLRPGGMLVASARGRWHAGADAAGGRVFSADELARLVGARGFTVTAQWAPGALARLRGSPASFDPDGDRQPGLRDAAPRLVVRARRPVDEQERSDRFLASLPRKVVAAATLCRDDDGRVLVVHDLFKASWTLPGGIVDADEDPRGAAGRETWEEAGVQVRVDRLLGVFAARFPDRLALVYAARPVGAAAAPQPVHAHEIGAAAWLPLDEALARLAPRHAQRVRRCLDTPGHSWPE